MTRSPRNFSEFWPHYVLAHRHPVTRGVHFTATLLGWALVVAAIFLRNAWLVLLAVVVPYPLVWLSHFFVEHNRPATFGHPLWSWLADQKMLGMMLRRRMAEEVQRAAREQQASDL